MFNISVLSVHVFMIKRQERSCFAQSSCNLLLKEGRGQKKEKRNPLKREAINSLMRQSDSLRDSTSKQLNHSRSHASFL